MPAAGSPAMGSTSGTSNDPSLLSTIQAAISSDPELAKASITVETVDGRAILKGTVANAQAKENAARIAGTVSGVKEVDNQLVVQG